MSSVIVGARTNLSSNKMAFTTSLAVVQTTSIVLEHNVGISLDKYIHNRKLNSRQVWRMICSKHKASWVMMKLTRFGTRRDLLSVSLKICGEVVNVLSHFVLRHVTVSVRARVELEIIAL